MYAQPAWLSFLRRASQIRRRHAARIEWLGVISQPNNQCTRPPGDLNLHWTAVACVPMHDDIRHGFVNGQYDIRNLSRGDAQCSGRLQDKAPDLGEIL